MRRVVSFVVMSMILVMALATPVAAQTPLEDRRVREDIPLSETVLTIEAAIGCEGFDVFVEDISGTVTYVFITEDRHGNILERVIYHTVSRYTNLETDATFERRFDSVGNYTTRPDGSVRIVGRNDALLWDGEAGLAPGIWLIDHGLIVVEYEPDGTPRSGEVVRSDEIIDVCAALS